jgi:hypothetical protein
MWAAAASLTKHDILVNIGLVIALSAKMTACRLLMKFAWPIEQIISISTSLFFRFTISLLSVAGIPPEYAKTDRCPHCISPAVTLDICKFTYAQFINWDVDMYDEARDMPAVATRYGKRFLK